MALLTILNVVVVGVVATLAMDVVAGIGVALHAFRIPAYGRSFLYAAKGTFRHADIDRAPPLRGENALMIPLHYLTGTVLAALYLLLLEVFSSGAGTVLLAEAYGLATSVIPLFVMLPSMGYGMLGLRHRGDTFWLRQILLMHLAYGLGIGLAVLLILPV